MIQGSNPEAENTALAAEGVIISVDKVSPGTVSTITLVPFGAGGFAVDHLLLNHPSRGKAKRFKSGAANCDDLCAHIKRMSFTTGGTAYEYTCNGGECRVYILDSPTTP
jgi:hypothetical protein